MLARLASEPLRVKLIGKGRRHEDAPKVALREEVEIAKAYEATNFAYQLSNEDARRSKEHVNFANMSKQEINHWLPTHGAVFIIDSLANNTVQSTERNVANVVFLDSFNVRPCRGGANRRQHQSNLFQDDDGSDEGPFAMGSALTGTQSEKEPGRKFFAHLTLIKGTQTKV